MRGFKILTPIAFVALTFVTGAYKWNPFMIPLIALALGYLVPGHVPDLARQRPPGEDSSRACPTASICSSSASNPASVSIKR